MFVNMNKESIVFFIKGESLLEVIFAKDVNSDIDNILKKFVATFDSANSEYKTTVKPIEGTNKYEVKFKEGTVLYKDLVALLIMCTQCDLDVKFTMEHVYVQGYDIKENIHVDSIDISIKTTHLNGTARLRQCIQKPNIEFKDMPFSQITSRAYGNNVDMYLSGITSMVD